MPTPLIPLPRFLHFPALDCLQRHVPPRLRERAKRCLIVPGVFVFEEDFAEIGLRLLAGGPRGDLLRYERAGGPRGGERLR